MNVRKPGRRLTEKQVRKRNIVFELMSRVVSNPTLLITGLVFYLVVAIFIVVDPPHVLRQGVPARDDLIARVEFSYEDTEETNRERTFAEALVSPIFLYHLVDSNLKRDMTVFLEAITQHDRIEDVPSEWIEPWKLNNQPLDKESFAHLSQGVSYLREREGSQALILEKFTNLVQTIEKLYIIDEKTGQKIQSLEKTIKIKVEEQSALVRVPLENVFVITQNKDSPRNVLLKLEKVTKEHLALVFNPGDLHSYDLIVQLLFERLAPTLNLDKEAFSQARQIAREKVVPVMRYVAANEVILRRNQVPEAKHLLMLAAENLSFENRTLQEKTIHRLRRGFGRFFVYTIVCMIFMMLITEGRPTVTRNKGRFFSFCLLSALVVMVSRLLIIQGHSPLWIPLPLMAEVFQVVHGRRSASLSIVFIGSLLGLSLEATGVAITMTLGSLVCIYCSKDLGSRLTLIVSGLIGGGVMALTDLAFHLQGEDLSFGSADRFALYLPESSVALANGFFTGIFLTGLLPVVEKIFKITTNITWLELSNMNRPLLKRMALEAPGSWQHSQVLATLSEAAAQRIGVNSLMARVVCYYHDIGKCIKPHYFVENQQGGQNPHDKLTPAMSALIIHSHPKDGEELARQHGLPREIVDAILQHHGTTRVEYFYRMALENAESPEDVQEDMFRYPGPIPQNKEMGIIMLADSVEGAVRAMLLDDREINPSRIRNQVEKIVKSKIDMNQLDESSLTLTEIKEVIEEFTRVLQSVYHNRIKYPKSPEEIEEDNLNEQTVEPTPS